MWLQTTRCYVPLSMRKSAQRREKGRKRRELWQMVHELAGEGMLILWSTSYLDEAEQCRDVLLMNEGELLYQGEPKALTQTMAGRRAATDGQ